MANNKKNKNKNCDPIGKPIPKSPSPASMVNPTSGSRLPFPPVLSKKTVIIRSGDMTNEMRYEAFDIADNAFQKHFLMDSDVAEEIKNEFDKRHGPTWHCIVGASYGTYITYAPKRYIHFYMNQKAVLLFKNG